MHSLFTYLFVRLYSSGPNSIGHYVWPYSLLTLKNVELLHLALIVAAAVGENARTVMNIEEIKPVALVIIVK